MVQENAVCDSYTKLKLVYDLQSETVPQRTASLSDNVYIRNGGYSSDCNRQYENQDDSPLPCDACTQENGTGFDRAKFLYDRICKTMPSMSVSSDLNTGHKTPPMST